jgi:predicted nucleic acid-binding protein
MQFIDANIFLEVLLKQKRTKECKAYLKRVETRQLTALTTDFIVDTISIIMDDAGCTPAQLRTFQLSLLKYEGLTLYDLTMADRVAATKLMEKHKLDFDDATVYAAMMSTGTKEVVSMDRKFDRIEGITRIEP